jgi:hypothetical protein
VLPVASENEASGIELMVSIKALHVVFAGWFSLHVGEGGSAANTEI